MRRVFRPGQVVQVDVRDNFSDPPRYITVELLEIQGSHREGCDRPCDCLLAIGRVLHGPGQWPTIKTFQFTLDHYVKGEEGEQ